jgi:RecA-family ATPase
MSDREQEYEAIVARHRRAPDSGRKANGHDVPPDDGVPPVENIEDFQQTAEPEGEVPGGSYVPLKPLPWIDMSKWDSEPAPHFDWAIRDRVPANQAGLFSGEGGTGKSILELMKNVAHVAGKDWLGSLPELGPAFYLGAEDEAKVIHIRLHAIAAHYGVTFNKLIRDGLHVMSLLGQDATLCAPTRSGKIETTALYRQIYEAAGDIKPKNISIDTLSRAFAGNEIDRVQVYAFAMHMQALAIVTNGGSVTGPEPPEPVGHRVRFRPLRFNRLARRLPVRQYLLGVKPDDGEQPDNDVRAFQFKKNQYGPLGETILLRWKNGLFLPDSGPSSLERAAHEAKADEVFMTLLRKSSGRGENVSENSRANNYAPHMFAADPITKKEGLRKRDLQAAMQRLAVADKIESRPYGPPSKRTSRLEIK